MQKLGILAVFLFSVPMWASELSVFKSMISYAGPSTNLSENIQYFKKAPTKELKAEICAQLSEMAGVAFAATTSYKFDMAKANDPHLFTVSSLQDVTSSLEGFCGVERNSSSPLKANDLAGLEEKLKEVGRIVNSLSQIN